MRVGDTRVGSGVKALMRLRDDPAEEDADRPASEREERRLEEELPEDARAPSPDREADADLFVRSTTETSMMFAMTIAPTRRRSAMKARSANAPRDRAPDDLNRLGRDEGDGVGRRRGGLAEGAEDRPRLVHRGGIPSTPPRAFT